MNKMTLLLARLTTVFACVLSISFVLIALWAFTFERYSPESGKYFDGFGRELHPGGLGNLYGGEHSPGLLWEVVDTVAAILLFGICSSLFVLARRLLITALGAQPNGPDTK